MATFKGIKGVKVQSKASDPTASEAEGTVWYNSTGDALKYAIAGAGAWASGGGMNTTRAQDGLAGSQTSAVISGAVAPAGDETLAETYDGTSWTEVNNLNTAKAQHNASGTQSSAIAFGGLPYPNATTETYDGTSWTEVADLATARYGISAGATNQTNNIAALCISGSVPPPRVTTVEEWNIPQPLEIKTFTTS